MTPVMSEVLSMSFVILLAIWVAYSLYWLWAHFVNFSRFLEKDCKFEDLVGDRWMRAAWVRKENGGNL